MFAYDQAILSLARKTPQSIPDVIGIMRSIQDLCAPNDGLQWFNWLYLQVTEAVASRTAAGGFVDNGWLAELDVQFAMFYFRALECELSGQSAPGCWRVLFALRGKAAIARIQFALAGINAHINHDLAAAIVTTCELTGTLPEYGGVRYADYTALNATLDTQIESAKRTLHVRLLGDPLPLVSHLEDTTAAWSVSVAREAAWRNAELLWHLRADPRLALIFLDALDGLAAVAGKALLVPVP